MLSFFKKKETGILIASPVKGKAVNITEVPDPTFGECMLGKGAAVIPEDGKIYAPVDGVIGLLFETLHAVSITSVEGVEILVHVGLDTVGLKGEGFKAHVAQGDSVKKGDLLLTADFEAIKNKGLNTITPVVICNTDEYKDVEVVKEGPVEPGMNIIKIIPN